MEGHTQRVTTGFNNSTATNSAENCRFLCLLKFKQLYHVHSTGCTFETMAADYWKLQSISKSINK